MDTQQIKELMTQLEESKLRKLVIKKGDFELQIEKETVQTVAPRPKVTHTEPEPAFQTDVTLKTNARSELSGKYVTSPMVGTFYSSPAPDQPSFVKVGDKVDENTVVCIVEAMKVMNEVKAGISGTVAEILTDNSQPVEFGTRLLRII